MKALEITPLENRRLRVIIVEKEYSEPFWILEPLSDYASKKIFSRFKPTIAFCTFLKKLIDEVKPDFITEERGNRSDKQFNEENPLAKIANEKKIPFFAVDMDENARSYITSMLEEKRQLRDRILKALQELSGEDDIRREYLLAYGQSLQEEIEEMEREIKFSVRESWIAMEIMENARKFERDELLCIHISSPEHIEGVKRLLESVDVDVEVIQPTKKLISSIEGFSTTRLEDLLKSMQIQVKPKIRTYSENIPYILFFLDPGEKASPFDICMAYDAGFNVVIPYENVAPREAKKIVQDALFSRDPRGVKRTCFFIGGKNMEKAEEVLKVVRESMFPPFQTNIIIDPAGAYTTAASLVAKIEHSLTKSNLGDLRNKRVAVFGTGAVGRVAAILLARLGCKVTIISPSNRPDGEEYITGVSRLLREKYGVSVEGASAPTPEKKLKLMDNADVIICAAAPGVRIITKEMLDQMKFVKVVADVNAVPPLGIEGIKLNDDMREIAPGIFGIGALTIGKLKYKVERGILEEARRNGGKGNVYSYDYAMDLARKILRGKLSAAKLAVTISYPSNSLLK